MRPAHRVIRFSLMGPRPQSVHQVITGRGVRDCIRDGHGLVRSRANRAAQQFDVGIIGLKLGRPAISEQFLRRHLGVILCDVKSQRQPDLAQIPTLSQWESERHGSGLGHSNSAGFADRLRKIPSLLLGEGRGEGEPVSHRFHGLRIRAGPHTAEDVHASPSLLRGLFHPLWGDNNCRVGNRLLAYMHTDNKAENAL